MISEPSPPSSLPTPTLSPRPSSPPHQLRTATSILSYQMEGLLEEEEATIPLTGPSSLHGQVIKGFRCHLSGGRPPQHTHTHTHTHRCQFLGVVLDPSRSKLEPAGARDSHCAPAAACPPTGRPETGLTLWTPHM